MALLRTWPRPLRDVLMTIAVIGAALLTVWALYTLPIWWRERFDPDAEVRSARSDFITDRRIEALQTRLRADPTDQAAYTQLGAAYVQKARESSDPGYYAKAEGVLTRALELKPDDFLAMSQMGALALARHQFREALEWGEQARALSPQTAMLYGVIGDAHVELGEYAEAEAAFQTMVDLRPDLSSYSRVSYLRELYGDWDGAVEAMTWAVRAGGPNAENTNWARVQLGHLYFNRGRLDEAEVIYQEALAAYPGYVHALAGLARVSAARGDFGRAIELYSEVVNRMPIAEYVIALGDVYQSAGQPELARQQYDLVRAMQPLYRANGVDVDLEMALFDADHGGEPRALLAQARQAYARRPSLHAADVLAWALYQAGDYVEARSYSQQALRMETRDALMLFHAGMIAYRLGDEAQAREYLEQALTINPYFSLRHADVAQRALSELRADLH